MVIDAEIDIKTKSFVDRVRREQQKSLGLEVFFSWFWNFKFLLFLGDLKALATQYEAPLIEVPYFDTEVRTVYGLRVISHCIFPPKNV